MKLNDLVVVYNIMKHVWSVARGINKDTTFKELYASFNEENRKKQYAEDERKLYSMIATSILEYLYRDEIKE